MRLGAEAARDGAVVTFGVKPDCPHTGYGYIETDEAESGAGVAAIKVRRFVEKPSREAAENYVDSGHFYWNAGIFLFRASTMLELFQVHAPEILVACRQALNEATTDFGFRHLGESYHRAPSISLDYAIMEQGEQHRLRAAVDLMERRRLVVGALELPREGQSRKRRERRGNDPVLRMPRATTPIATTPRVALVGVENLVVVAMGDAVLVASKESAEAIKSVVDQLKGNGEDIARQHNRVLPPVGLVSRPQSWRPLPSEVHHGEARGDLVATEPQPPIGALGGGAGHACGDQR